MAPINGDDFLSAVAVHPGPGAGLAVSLFPDLRGGLESLHESSELVLGGQEGATETTTTGVDAEGEEAEEEEEDEEEVELVEEESTFRRL
eukprot:CAMPEP_0201483108 /NCGR_PEP_ID=MMETSP0151_2-20130828/7339_1 /ASSEMBLY_ACC=CAM_ASM_000257 /TAXON_ID=200890 /ORGANISM="Paramoeba atlantica, Strain 621/1 / CCAP 1560/9" /LENGTH=89 /DNA_ID=CAMNT_0047866091 /DNA_START=865 /DNA_END=1135 /DNA_ORIENTATION=+